ncbi:RNA-binding protein 5 isoform X2 [Silurus meridionalis]|uniref:RNA-binding protein 5 isoform X2 n=1 Tax=Silurus meridionalis TaxID=175797 RepID=UPI001EEC1C8B|nr:RNA-binding protein 5 isoform X2 [Silurus meridionalis]
MWNGSRSGQRGGMPFCGDSRGEMFERRNGPMPGFRGQKGINMGCQDRPPMDMRRFDHPPDMVGRNMGLFDRGRDSPRDRFMPQNELDIRRRFEMEQNAPGFMGQGRPPIDMGGRDMQIRNMRGPEDQFMDMRERDRFRMDMPGFNMSPMDIRRRIAMESMDRNDHVRENVRERPQVGMNDIDGFSMDMPLRERSVDFDRRGCPPPLNSRGRFESDTDFRNRIGPSGDFRDRSPQMFHGGDAMNLKGRPELPLDRQGPGRAGEPTLRDREFPEQTENRSGFRGDDEKSLSDEWCRRINRGSNSPRDPKKRFAPGLDKQGDLGELSQFNDRERQLAENKAKDRGTLEFSRSEREVPTVQNWDSIPTGVPVRDPSHLVTKKVPLLPLNPSLNIPSKVKESQGQWSREEKPDSIVPSAGRHPFFPEKSLSVKESQFSVAQGNCKGKDMPLDEGQKKGNLIPGPRDPQNNREGRRDQDYGDIDYRTSSVQKYDYILEDFQGPEKDIKAPKPVPPERTSASGSKDQDYRNASVQDKIANTIAISGIPKTATMQQILNAFAVRDGVPMQGMKIRDVVPGYSSDTAYVEFLNIEDAVHFMESNQGSVKVGSKIALLKYIQSDRSIKEPHEDQPHKAIPSTQDGLLPCPVLPNVNEEGCAKTMNEPVSQSGWQRSSNLTPEAWQQQVDKQQEMEKQAEEQAQQRGPRLSQQVADPVFKESKTMIIKNILPTTTVETILRSLDTFAYLDERNVRLVKGKTPGSKCFCFVDMDSHEQVTRLVDLLTKPRPIVIDGVRVYAEVAKPLKNQIYKKDYDKSNTSLLGFPPDVIEQQQYFHPTHTAISSTTQDSSLASASIQESSLNQGAVFAEASVEATEQQTSSTDTAYTDSAGGSEDYSYISDTPDLSAFLFDATSGFYYDPQTTLYYDPNSRYFYNAQTQQYLYWDSASKIYIPVEGEGSGIDAQKVNVPVEAVAETVAAEELKMPSEGGPERREDDDTMPRSEKKEKEDKPRSLAAFKIMKDMERWAKIQNRQKDSVRAPSPVLRSGAEDKKASKAADAAFAVFERKAGGDDLFKKPFAPPRKEEKTSKKPMGSLGMLAADYAAGSDEEEEEKHEKHEAPAPPAKSQPEPQEKEDKLTDWKKMACLLCRRQFPSKDALIRHQQLSDLHKQNMEIHLKIKKSKRELEALENQEKEMHMKETHSPPEAKKRKQSTFPSSSRDTHKGNERPGLGLETTERSKKEAVVWNAATYKQAVRKAMFARFKELE